MLPLLRHLQMVRPSRGSNDPVEMSVPASPVCGCKRTTEDVKSPGCDQPQCLAG